MLGITLTKLYPGVCALRTATGADAGHDLTLGQMPVTDQPLAAVLAEQVGWLEKHGAPPQEESHECGRPDARRRAPPGVSTCGRLSIDRAVPLGLIQARVWPDAGGQMSVKLVAGVGYGEARLRVADNGRGINCSRLAARRVGRQLR